MRSVRLAMSAMLLFAFVAVGAVASGANGATNGATPSEARLRVVFFPFGGGAESVRAAGEAELEKFVGRVADANPLYVACSQGAVLATDNPATPCDAAGANVIVSTTLRAADNGDSTLVVQSFDIGGRRALGSIQKAISSRASATSGASDATTTTNLQAALAQLSGSDDARTLIGTPVVRDGRLAIQSGHQAFIQLIPDVSSSDPTYVGVLQNLLAKRGIASAPSQFNAGTVTSGNVGADALCGLGQRYLVYAIAKRTEDRILSLNTRVETRATGHLYDCPTRTDLAFGDTARTFATNTKQSIGPFLTLLGSLFVSKTNSWQNAATTGGLLSAIVDVKPELIQEHTAEITLQKLVDDFCGRILTLPTPLPAPSAVLQTAAPSPPPSGLLNAELQSMSAILGAAAGQATSAGPSVGSAAPTGGATPAGGGASSGAGSSAVPLDIGNFLSDSSPVLKCDKPMYRDLPRTPPYTPIFHSQ